jgi:Zn finger protein HypA/HybF involved in hydrogenase expression
VILRNLKKKTAQQASPNPIEAIIIKPEVECPYCHTKFQEKDIVILCPNCKTLHHKDCWLENRGCAIFGCWQRK